MKTLTQEKANVARLRDLYENETDPLIKESIRFRLAEARLWHDVAESGIIEPEQVKPKAYRRVKYTVIGITIAVLLAIVLSGCNVVREGCHLIGAAGQDVGWMANKIGDNINVKEK